MKIRHKGFIYNIFIETNDNITIITYKYKDRGRFLNWVTECLDAESIFTFRSTHQSFKIEQLKQFFLKIVNENEELEENIICSILETMEETN